MMGFSLASAKHHNSELCSWNHSGKDNNIVAVCKLSGRSQLWVGVYPLERAHFKDFWCIHDIKYVYKLRLNYWASTKVIRRNTSFNPHVSAFPRNSNSMDRMCQCHGGNWTSTLHVLAENSLYDHFVNYHISSWGVLTTTCTQTYNKAFIFKHLKYAVMFYSTHNNNPSIRTNF